MEKVNGGAHIPALADETDCPGGQVRILKDHRSISKDELAEYIGDLIMQLRRMALKSGDVALAERLLAAYEAVVRDAGKKVDR